MRTGWTATASTTRGSGSATPTAAAGRGCRQRGSRGDRIGMLLDLDQGSMSVWKGGVEMGVMQAEGLSTVLGGVYGP